MVLHKEGGLERLFLRIAARGELSATEKHALTTAVSERRSVAKGSDVVVEGTKPTSSTLLLAGLASRYNVLDDGRRQITAVHVPGDFVDLHSFPLPKMDHSIGALTDCEVLTFSHSSLRQVTDAHPNLTRQLWMLTLLDGAIHRRWLVAMGRLSATGHLSQFICEIYLRLVDVGLASNMRMTLSISQSDLADIIGLSAVHTNRVLQELRKLQLLRWEGREVEILHWDGLASIAEFDDTYLFRDLRKT